MIKKNILLSDYSNFKIGGSAAYLLEVSLKEELISGLKEWQEMNIRNMQKPFVLAGGTNILIDDLGYQGLIILNRILGIKQNETTLTVGSGVLISDLLNFCVENSLSGLEWAGGLPGTIGGAVRGNAGSFNGETKDSILEVESINLETLQVSTRKKSDCDFSYRSSFYKTAQGENEFITEIKLVLTKGQKEEIQSKINEKIEYRKEKHPLEYPSIGSTFKNIPYDTLSDELKGEFRGFVKTDPFPVVPVTKLINLVGLKGKIIGGAQFSEKQPNFIINLRNASSEDVKALIVLAKKTIKEKYGIEIEEEIMYLGGEENGR
jgi:UDP-N-acetylmuramate dehydrogenase